MARLCVVGTGHVGLVYAVAFALQGHDVVATDVDAKAIASLRKGVPTFFEPGLQEAFQEASLTGRLSFSSDVEAGTQGAQVAFLSVGTPSRTDGSIDLAYVESAAQAIGRGVGASDGYRLVVVKSTVLPGTTEGIVLPTLEKASGKRAGPDFGLCMNPEFLREGSAVGDAMKPDRIVIGGLDARSSETLEQVYARMECLTFRTDLRTAEMIKYATNAFLATKVSFANDLANLCDAYGGIDVDRVVEGMALDPRINPRFLKAGLGFGGSCFPKDVRAIVAAGKARGYEPRVFQAALQVNDSQPMRAVDLAERALGSLKGTRVAILGLSFKGGSDDVRESRAIPLAEALLSKGANVVGYDPVANDAFARAVPQVELAPDVERALAHADVCIIHNDWPQWRALTSSDFAGMRRRLVIDGRRILNREALDGVELHVLGG
ncbi:MAG TPA: UDP-glucose/GDP-mannose dehydrogenase family protein [Thermoplasmata archaeon]|nr:UDP-glucose/GDP-mannose dehydrogenase family protein [Thermoplasmata archaeon]